MLDFQTFSYLCRVNQLNLFGSRVGQYNKKMIMIIFSIFVNISIYRDMQYNLIMLSQSIKIMTEPCRNQREQFINRRNFCLSTNEKNSVGAGMGRLQVIVVFPVWVGRWRVLRTVLICTALWLFRYLNHFHTIAVMLPFLSASSSALEDNASSLSVLQRNELCMASKLLQAEWLNISASLCSVCSTGVCLTDHSVSILLHLWILSHDSSSLFPSGFYSEGTLLSNLGQGWAISNIMGFVILNDIVCHSVVKVT